MSGPLIPYIQAPEIPLGFLHHIPLLGSYINAADPPSIKPFGTLVALGVYIGSVVSMNRAKERGLDTKQLSDFIFWVVASGFVISHILDAIAYHPQTVLNDPLYLLKIWDGLSSYGGLIGAVFGAVAWGMYRKKRVLEYIDVCVSAFPLAWVFGRSGCAVVHDHPGAISDAWFAVQFPNTICPDGFPEGAVCGRYDLGLIEMVLTIPLAVACWWLWKTKPGRPHGTYVAVTLIAYAPVRFILDFLRVPPDEHVFRGATDPRYWGLTPAQWVCFLALGLGLYFFTKVRGKKYEVTKELLAVEEGPDEALPDDDDDPYAADAPDSAEDGEPPKPARKKAPAAKAKKKKRRATKKKTKAKAAEESD